MNRRSFNRLCSSLLAGAATLSREGLAKSTSWPESLIVNSKGEPVLYDSLAVGSAHIFAYPYKTTPCFLIRLKPADYGTAELTDRSGNTYQWIGGVGSDQALVAFSAICTHKMTHPAKPLSHINFRPDTREFLDSAGKKKKQNQLITCCSEYSIYDPTQGAKVMSGPATQPLASIALKVENNSGHIYATGCYGGNMFDEFLTKFGFRLSMENKVSDPRTLVSKSTELTPAEDYSRQQIRC